MYFRDGRYYFYSISKYKVVKRRQYLLTVNSLEPARSQKIRISFPVIYSKRAASVTLEIGLGQNSKKKS